MENLNWTEFAPASMRSVLDLSDVRAHKVSLELLGGWRAGLPTTIPFSHNPIFGNEKSQPIPTSGILFLNQFPKMGLKFSTNSQCGKVKFNQFPVSNGNFFSTNSQSYSPLGG